MIAILRCYSYCAPACITSIFSCSSRLFYRTYMALVGSAFPSPPAEIANSACVLTMTPSVGVILQYKTDRARPTAPRAARQPNPTQPYTAVQPKPTPNLPNSQHPTQPNPTLVRPQRPPPRNPTNPTQPYPTPNTKPTQPNPTLPNPTQPNLLADRIHPRIVVLWKEAFKIFWTPL